MTKESTVQRMSENWRHLRFKFTEFNTAFGSSINIRSTFDSSISITSITITSIIDSIIDRHEVRNICAPSKSIVIKVMSVQHARKTHLWWTIRHHYHIHTFAFSHANEKKKKHMILCKRTNCMQMKWEIF